ncbi:MAG: isoleucine--tRNA ligase [Candidatus Nealsonbacteria bacterium]|nr:isoleucine--tRNA ligase [Candidatus Nealsonbacteria bacterium]
MLNFPENEKKILNFWKERKIFEKLREKNRGKEPWSFLDGPITANNPMGVHHAWGRTYKDVFQRQKAMQGFDLRFQNGFDCQGLWVEVEVEKELGFKSKKDIEKFGVEKFVNLCKERVKKYSKIQTDQSIRLGQWMDWENSYYTMSEENNYAIWNFLKKCWQEGLLYKGQDVVPWCLRCGTAISQHEILTEEYKEIIHKAIFIKLALVGKKNIFFLAWTTTPWTLPANVALAVHPDLDYVEVKDEKGDVFILLKEKSNLIPEGKIIKTIKGKSLKGLKYKGLFDELAEVKKSLKSYKHQIVLWKEVNIEEGTGIVHMAPGCGQEDFKLSKELKLPVINPTDQESKYKKGFGSLSSKLVTETNNLIFKDLAKKDFVFKIEDYKHRYPTCWRCKSELIFRLVNEWYISMEKTRERLIKAAKQIKWIPSFGLERELDWLKNMQDWLISKKRYWGLALPIYECKECGNFEVIGSKEELKERAIAGWEKFDGHSPHKPWIDEVKIKCSKCKKSVSRILDVGNPWLDAGIVPFSTMRYFSDKDYWKKWFPIELVCESFPGQFKNWFYSILVMSVVLEDKAPVKTIFGYALVKDEKGEEMHKSKGNAIWFDDAVEIIGADIMRWMYSSPNPALNLMFGYKVADEFKKKIFNLWNSFTFFETYVSKEEIKAVQKEFSGSNNILDKWIISSFNSLIKEVTQSFERYDLAKTIGLIENFFIEDLSLWYIRRSRKRFQRPENEKEKKEARETLHFILLNLMKLIAPTVPFFAENFYQELKTKDLPESVHLCDWPIFKEKEINKDLEDKMKKIREIVAIALSERKSANIRVRQPLSELKIKNEFLKEEKALLELIKDEVNVKNIVFDNKIKKEIELDFKISEELREEGMVREVLRQIQVMRKKADYKPRHRVQIQYTASPKLNGILSKNKDFILKESKAEKFELGEKPKLAFDVEIEMKIDQENLWLAIKKI